MQLFVDSLHAVWSENGCTIMGDDYIYKPWMVISLVKKVEILG